jgi:hypothetical protein
MREGEMGVSGADESWDDRPPVMEPARDDRVDECTESSDAFDTPHAALVLPNTLADDDRDGDGGVVCAAFFPARDGSVGGLATDDAASASAAALSAAASQRIK